jgi:hypothetical protein
MLSKMILLTFPNSLFAGFISLYVGLTSSLRVASLRVASLRVASLRVCESVSCESASCESTSHSTGPRLFFYSIV